GIASAIVHNGEILANSGTAGEVGHGSATSGELCACGGRGCLETYASAAGIARRYSALSGQQVAGAVEVLEKVQAGDPTAIEIWDTAIAGLADLLSQIVRLLGKTRIVIGGGLSLAGPALFTPLAKATAARLPIQPLPEITPSAFADKSAIYGAALLGWDAAAC
ncbi:MAG: ROK family protein, partial [Propionibacteriaceae bacterium]|nr:ROK family protein [Propionibacteriaceae bacterium]